MDIFGAWFGESIQWSVIIDTINATGRSEYIEGAGGNLHMSKNIYQWDYLNSVCIYLPN